MPDLTRYADPRQIHAPTIALGSSESSAIDLGAGMLRRVDVDPDDWDTAYLGIKPSADGGVTYGDLLVDVYGSLVLLPAVAGRPIAVPIDLVDSLRHFKLVSCDATGTAVVQTAARTLTVTAVYLNGNL